MGFGFNPITGRVGFHVGGVDLAPDYESKKNRICKCGHKENNHGSWGFCNKCKCQDFKLKKAR